MNYTLVAYIICTAIIITILAQPQIMITSLREESYEKHQALDYWLVVNALSYAYNKSNPVKKFIDFLESELNTLDPRIVEVPGATIKTLIIRLNHVEAVVVFNYSWGSVNTHVLLAPKILKTSSEYDERHNIMIVTAKIQILSDRLIRATFDALKGELLDVKCYPDQVYELRIGIVPNLRAIILVQDSRGLRVVVRL